MMSEEIQNTQFSVREVPWMKLGKLVDQPVTAKEAAKLGGLNFSVSLRDVYYGAPNVSLTAIPKRKAVVANDNGQFMGFVSNSKYNVLQYTDAFSFMDTVGLQYVAAGALRDRRQGFMVVKPEIQFNVLDGDDPHELYAVLRTSHDCTRAIEVSVMPLRQRCMNQMTLRSFTKGVQYRWAIKHTSTMHEKLKEAQNSLKKIGLYAKRYEVLAQRLVDTSVNVVQAREMLKITIPTPVGRSERVEEQYLNRIDTIVELWQTSPTVAYAGTGWGLVNALSEYYDWFRTLGTPQSRFLSALEGESHKRINKLTGLVLAA
jgi:phage/plasmid-like protein (TIGR03299 family)